MKVNINKFQQGGGFATFTPYLAAAATVATSTASSDTSSKKSDTLVDDDIFKEFLKEGGLTNDVDAWAKELLALQMEPTPFTMGENRSRAITLMAQVNRLKESRKDWESAVKTATAEGGLSEIAVGSYGQVYAKDKNNNVREVTVDTYKDNSDQLQLLTVSELMRERKLNPKLVGKDNLFEVANNAIGMKKIADQIQGVVQVLGSETISKTASVTKGEADAAIKNASPEDKENMAILKKVLMGQTGMAEIKTVSVSERNHSKQALDYIWGTLGKSAQLKLATVSSLNGEKDPRSYIAKILEFGTDFATTTEITPKETAEDKAAAKQTEKGMKPMTTFQMLHKDALANVNTTFALNDPKMGSMFRGVVGGISPVILKDGTQIGPTTIKKVLEAGYNQFLKGNKVFFGEKQVNVENLQNIVYDGQDGAKVYLPINEATGAPDYESLTKFKNLYAVWEANKNKWSVGQAKRYFKQGGGFDVVINEEKDENGNSIQVFKGGSDVKPFWLMYGYTTDDTDLIEGNEKWTTELKGAEESTAQSITNAAWAYKEGKKEKSMKPSGKWLEITDYYKGIVAIPYRDDAAAIVDAMVGQGPMTKSATLGDVQRNLKYSSNTPLNRNTSSLQIK